MIFFCRYLRLSKNSIKELEQRSAKAGVRVGIHGHMSAQDAIDFLRKDGPDTSKNKESIYNRSRQKRLFGPLKNWDRLRLAHDESKQTDKWNMLRDVVLPDDD